MIPNTAQSGTVGAPPGWQALRALAVEVGLVATPPALLLLTRYFSWGAGVFRLCTLLALFLFVAWATSRRPKLHSVFTSGHYRLGLIAFALWLGFAQTRAFVHDMLSDVECTTDMGRPSICAGEWLLRGMNPWAECAVAVPPRSLRLPKAQLRPKSPPKAPAAVKRAPPKTAPVNAAPAAPPPPPAAKPKAAPPKPPAAKPKDTWSWCLVDDRCIDSKSGGTYAAWTHHGAGFDFMDGYKYGPLMALLYLPVTHFLVEPGISVVNFVFWMALLALCAWLARTAYPALPCAPWRSLVGFLLPAAIPLSALLPRAKFEALGHRYRLVPPDPMGFLHELTVNCSNDIIPVVLVLCAVLLAAQRRSFLAGVFCGLSLATKQLPAPLVALLLVRLDGVSWRRFLVGTVATASLIYLPFFLWSPREMIANLVLFGAVRPTNTSSIRSYLPAALQPLVTLLQLGALAFFVLRWARAKRRDLAALLPIAALLLTAFVAFNKVVHGNYLIWLQPFVALALSGAPFQVESGAAGASLRARLRASAGRALASLRWRR